MVDEEGVRTGDGVLSGPGDQAESGNQAAVDAVITCAANGLGPLCHQDLEIVTEERMRVGGVQLSGGGRGAFLTRRGLLLIGAERAVKNITQGGRAAEFLPRRE